MNFNALRTGYARLHGYSRLNRYVRNACYAKLICDNRLRDSGEIHILPWIYLESVIYEIACSGLIKSWILFQSDYIWSKNPNAKTLFKIWICCSIETPLYHINWMNHKWYNFTTTILRKHFQKISHPHAYVMFFYENKQTHSHAITQLVCVREFHNKLCTISRAVSPLHNSLRADCTSEAHTTFIIQHNIWCPDCMHIRLDAKHTWTCIRTRMYTDTRIWGSVRALLWHLR